MAVTVNNVVIEDNTGNIYLPNTAAGIVSYDGNSNGLSGISNVADALTTISGGGCVIIAEGSGANTVYYLQRGADPESKKKLSSGATVFSITTGPNQYNQSSLALNISQYYSNYKNITADNIFVKYATNGNQLIVQGSVSSFEGIAAMPTISYDPTTGNLYLTASNSANLTTLFYKNTLWTITFCITV